MVDNHFRWDFIGLSTDTKPTPATSSKVVDGSTFYCSDNSKLYVYCKDQWYEKTATGGASYTAGDGISIAEGTISVDPTYVATLEELDARINKGAGAPTTATEGVVGGLYEDTTNGKLYICTAVTEGTDPDPDTYTWSEVGAGGSVTDLTSDDFDFPVGNVQGIALWNLEAGVYRNASGTDIYLYYSGTNTNHRAICRNNDTFSVLYHSTYYDQPISVTYMGFDSGNPRLITSSGTSTGERLGLVSFSRVANNLTTGSAGSNVLDAYQGKVLNDKVEGRVITGTGAPTTATVGTVGLLYEDTTNGKLYICTAVTAGTDPDPTTYTWEEVGAGGGGGTPYGRYELTEADFNWNSSQGSQTEPYNSIALWLMPCGSYYVNNSTRASGHKVPVYVYSSMSSTDAETSFTAYDVIPDTQYSERLLINCYGRGGATDTQGKKVLRQWMVYNTTGYSIGSATILATKDELNEEVKAITLSAVPTTSTEGIVGRFYKFNDNGTYRLFICMAYDNSTSSYIWKEVTLT